MAQSASGSSPLSSAQNVRPKQREIVEALLTSTAVIAQLPTGYGKTKAGALGFAELRHHGKVNRLLWIVPRRRLAQQAAQDVPEELQKFGINTKALIVGTDRIQSKSAHAIGSIVVFICTVQSLLKKETYETVLAMMETGKWMVVVDEHHHFAIEGQWTNKVRALKFCSLLAMSATAQRRDGADHFGDPQIRETYRNAAQQGYVKELTLHAYHYTIDAVEIDGTVHHFTTEELAEQAGSEDPEAIDAWLSSRKMRFSPKYISPLVMFPIDRIVDKRTRGLRTQLLVQAMSCSHAKCVVEQIKSLTPEGFTIDWVGTGPHGRTDEENESILTNWCPDKDPVTGARNFRLDCLVNVGMAGEGTDSIDVSEVSFLTPGNITSTNKQVIGRGARPIIYLPPSVPQPRCNINVDTGSPMAAYIDNIEDIFDEDIEPPDEPEKEPSEREPNEYEELPDHLGWMIADVHFHGIRTTQMFQAIFEETKVRTERDTKWTEQQVSEIAAHHAERVLREYLNRNNNQSAILAQKADQVEMAVSKIAGLVIRRIMQTGIRPERTLSGDIKKRINTRKKMHFGSAKNASEEILEQHWNWLKKLENEILHAHGLQGVPSWLR
jgi:superfamily II DNA or RNA helicase